MKCRRCGKQLTIKMDFCPNCGEPISDEEWAAWEQSETKQAKPDPVKKILIACIAVLLVACIFLVGILIGKNSKLKTEDTAPVPGGDSSAAETAESADTGQKGSGAESAAESSVTEYLAESTESSEPSEMAGIPGSGSDWAVVQGASPENGIDYTDRSGRLGSKDSYDVHFHIMFAENADGDGISQDDSLPYIGAYVSTPQADNTDPQYYTWHKADEVPAGEGLMGTWYDYRDFVFYLHIAYAADESGSDFSTEDASGRNYIGYLIDNQAADSDEAGKYTWIAR